MKELRETLIKNIIHAETEQEIECLVLDTITLLRSHMVNEFVIARFINKLTIELSAKGFDKEEVLKKIPLLHPNGLQWQFE